MTPSSPQNNAYESIDFIHKFDGSQPEVSADEQLAAAQLLEGAVEHTLISHADYTVGRLFTYLRMGIPYEDQTSLSFVITSSSIMKEGGAPAFTVRLIATDKLGDPRETYDYELSNDCTSVRRVDIGDETAKRENKEPGVVRVFGPDMALSPAADDSVQNFRLEEQMGLNNQPVSLSEVEKVCKLLSMATPVSN